MKLRFDVETFIERLAESIEIDWTVAHQAEDDGDWTFRWNRIQQKLDGMMNCAIYWVHCDRDEYAEMRDNLWLLRHIAGIHYMDIIRRPIEEEAA